jgi:uncharacterized protein YaiE (UPF0345 family)
MLLFARDDGLVAVGHNNPQATLDVMSTLQISGMNATLQAASGQSLILRQTNNGNLHLDSSGLVFFREYDDVGPATYNRMVFDPDSGTLTIGDWIIGPTARLTVHSPDSSASYAMFSNATSGVTGLDSFVVGINASEEAELRHTENTPLRIFTNNTERITVLANGDIGIRDTAPDGAFEINPNGVEDDGDELVVNSSGEIGIGTSNPSNMRLRVVDGNATVSVDNTVGIQIINSGETVQIGADSNAPGVELRDTDGTGLTPYIDFSNDSLIDYDARILLTANDNLRISGADLEIGSSGDVHDVLSWGGFFYQTSDARLKQNIVPLNGSIMLDKFNQLQGVAFDWTSTGQRSIGLLSQEVQKVFPELVAEDEETGYKAVAYTNLIAPLIEAIKAQQREIDALSAEIKQLREHLDAKAD